MRRGPIVGAMIVGVSLLLPGCSTADQHGGIRASAFNETVAGPARIAACGVRGIKPGTRPAHSRILTDAQASCLVRRSRFEPRPENYRANHYVPSAAELRRFRRLSTNPYKGVVTGHFAGTTDEIIQWAAWKWGIAPDVLRAVAVLESYWRQGWAGDGSQSFGIMQNKVSSNPGTYPLSKKSTAFNVDYYGASLHYYYDGWATWLGPRYHAGDLWASVGAHFKAQWHSESTDRYAGGVQAHMRKQTWRGSYF